MTEAILVFALAIGLGWPLGRYLAAVMRSEPMRLDRAFAPVERPLYRLLGTDPARGKLVLLDGRGRPMMTFSAM